MWKEQNVIGALQVTLDCRTKLVNVSIFIYFSSILWENDWAAMLSAKRSTGVALKSESEEFILCKWVDQWSPTKEQMPPKMLINSMCQWIHPVISNPFSITDVLIRSLLPIDFARFPKSGELMCSVSCHLRFTCKSFDTCIFAVCSCDLTGALLDTPCDRVSGQCTCKEGIEGRKCDKCKQFYVNFGPSGCTSEYALLV